MKKTSTAVVACLLAAPLFGCTSLRMHQQPQAAVAPPKVAEGDAVERFVTSWNANAAKIQSVKCDHVDVEGDSEGQIVTLNAKLAFQQPADFRLLGRFAGKSEIDLGSNSEEIWFWIARAKPPAVYFCKREDLPRVKLAIPFQPDWIVEVLGVAPIDAADYTPDQANDKLLSLKTVQTSPGGRKVVKRLVVDRATNRIRYFELFDENRTKLAIAQVEEYYEDAATRTFMPRRIKIRWEETKTELTLSMRRSDITVNTITPDYAAMLFKRGQFANAEPVDLAAEFGSPFRRSPAAAPAEPVQASARNTSFNGSAAMVGGADRESDDPAPRRPRAVQLGRQVQAVGN
ncbi:MAG: hypothetical protein ACRDD1_08985 [Planctomycetia bacterium]